MTRSVRRAPLWLGLGLAAGLACAEAPAPRPNVLLIVVDTLRADALGAYGSRRPTSPHLDALAAGGLRFARAYSQAPWTTASIGSLLTSRHPSELGLRSALQALPEGVPVLAEMLRDAGLATGAVVSHYFCSSRWGFARGFDAFDESQILGHQGISSAGVSDAGIAFLEAHAERPFFLFLHYFDPHFAYFEQEGFAFDRPEDYRGPVHSGMPFEVVRFQPSRFDPVDLRELRRLYDSEVAYTDHHIGRVLARLSALGLAGTTAVVVTADHGEEFREHGGFGHARSLYDETLHVPLILRLPGVAPAVEEAPVALLDVVPTLLDALDLPAPPGLRGRSLLGPVDDAPRPIFAESFLDVEKRAVILGDHKLIHDLARDRRRLYDRGRDPGETRDLRRQDPKTLRRLRRALQRFAKQYGGEVAAPDLAGVGDETRAQLRELGYLQ